MLNATVIGDTKTVVEILHDIHNSETKEDSPITEEI